MKVQNIDESKLIQLPKQTEKVIGEILLMEQLPKQFKRFDGFERYG